MKGACNSAGGTLRTGEGGEEGSWFEKDGFMGSSGFRGGRWNTNEKAARVGRL
jgi:hypothetical protein